MYHDTQRMCVWVYITRKTCLKKISEKKIIQLSFKHSMKCQYIIQKTKQ